MHASRRRPGARWPHPGPTTDLSSREPRSVFPREFADQWPLPLPINRQPRRKATGSLGDVFEFALLLAIDPDYGVDPATSSFVRDPLDRWVPHSPFLHQLLLSIISLEFNFTVIESISSYFLEFEVRCFQENSQNDAKDFDLILVFLFFFFFGWRLCRMCLHFFVSDGIKASWFVCLFWIGTESWNEKLILSRNKSKRCKRLWFGFQVFVSLNDALFAISSFLMPDDI